MMKHHALSAANEIYIQGILMQFLALLVEDAGCTVSPQQNTSSVYINQAISYIHKNYQNPLTVQEIADYLSLNRSYLTELFLKTVQLSPQQFLTRYRITNPKSCSSQAACPSRILPIPADIPAAFLFPRHSVK